MSNSFEKNLSLAIKRMEEIFDDEYFNNYKNGFCEIYPFTTENIDGYINYFNLKNKSLLTVGSSGDQALNAILNGCKDITIIDINSYVKYYYYLKVAGIMNLNYNEFLIFFRYKDYPKCFVDNLHAFSREVYDKIKDTLRILDYESYLFWDELFLNYDSNTIRTRLFSSDEGQSKEILTINTYLKDIDNYNELKSKIKNIRPKFINDDIFNGLFSKTYFKRKFDNIWLSNLSSYNSTLDISYLVDALDKILNKNGSILISYMYDTQLNSDYNYRDDWPEIYDLNKTLRFFSKYNPIFLNFQGIEGIKFKTNEIQDAALVYKKNR